MYVMKFSLFTYHKFCVFYYCMGLKCKDFSIDKFLPSFFIFGFGDTDVTRCEEVFAAPCFPGCHSLLHLWTAFTQL